MTGARIYNWPEMKRQWLAGDFRNYKDMAKKTGISQSTITKRAVKEGWFKRRKEVEAKIELKVEERIAEIAAKKYDAIIKRHLECSDILLDLGFNTFKGKKKIRSESNALSSIRLGLETQRKAIRGFADDEEGEQTVNNQFNQQINIYSAGTQEECVNQIAKTLEILAEEAHVIPKPKTAKDTKDEH